MILKKELRNCYPRTAWVKAKIKLIRFLSVSDFKGHTNFESAFRENPCSLLTSPYCPLLAKKGAGRFGEVKTG